MKQCLAVTKSVTTHLHNLTRCLDALIMMTTTSRTCASCHLGQLALNIILAQGVYIPPLHQRRLWHISPRHPSQRTWRVTRYQGLLAACPCPKTSTPRTTITIQRNRLQVSRVQSPPNIHPSGRGNATSNLHIRSFPKLSVLKINFSEQMISKIAWNKGAKKGPWSELWVM